MRELSMVSLALLGGTILAGPPVAGAETDDLITGTSLVIKPGNLAKLSGKGTLDLPDAENAPNVRGGTLVIFEGGGPARDAYRLPASGWTGLGTPGGIKGWQYKATGTDDDPCTLVKVTPKAVKATCKKAGVTLTPPFTGPVAAVLSIGSGLKQYCASFGGKVVKNDSKEFKATKAPAPSVCPLSTPTWDLAEQKTLLPYGALGGLCFFPDQGMALVPGIPQFRVLTWAATCNPTGPPLASGTTLFEGTDLEHLQAARRVLTDARTVDSGMFDGGYAGISSVYRHVDGRLYGFYHAEDWDSSIPPLAPGPGGYPGYYASVGAAVSDDDGESWQKLGPVVTGSKPKDFSAYPGQPVRGVGEPSAVADPNGRYLYIYFQDETGVDEDGELHYSQVGAARADLREGPPTPGQFKKYYAGGFAQSALGGAADLVLNVISRHAIADGPRVVYSQYLRRYVMVFQLENLIEQALATPPLQSGLHLAFSIDGISWSEPQQLWADHVLPISGKSLSWKASILWDDEAGQRGWLVYGYTPRVWAPGTYMVGRRIEFH